ncbi:uncharacterized protein DS421_19g650730 [Arachis hypogaea]|uniref:Uncharacterized protein n=1 Tax=Arachis hypogaea TaxID=3818 RepID=A0A6B9VAE7_ARAHY|nr:uncharacterized protein DS421_19g650730 [Arachis hypogaea]
MLGRTEAADDRSYAPTFRRQGRQKLQTDHPTMTMATEASSGDGGNDWWPLPVPIVVRTVEWRRSCWLQPSAH